MLKKKLLSLFGNNVQIWLLFITDFKTKMY